MYFPMFIPPISIFGLMLKQDTYNDSNHTISVIIPTKNRSGFLNKVVENCKNQNLKPTEIFIVDDNSDIPVDIQDCTLIRNAQTKGKAESVNSVLDRVKTDLVCIVDDDTVMDKDYFRKVSNSFSDKEIVASCGQIVPLNIGIIPNVRYIDYIYGQSTYKRIQAAFKMVLVSAGCSTVWRSEYIKSHKIPSKTVIEDLDATWVAETEGNKVAFISNTRAYTIEPTGLKQYYNQVRRWFSLIAVIKKNKLNNRLKVLVSWICVEFLAQFVFFGGLAFMLFSKNYGLAGILLGIDFVIVLGVVAYHNHKLLDKPFWKILIYMPFYYIYRIINNVIYLISTISPKTKWSANA
jgi:cellulose synthase/poly-beta-1,6-N-acetylglucosamine synthase-like glycosyltransferase